MNRKTAIDVPVAGIAFGGAGFGGGLRVNGREAFFAAS